MFGDISAKKPTVRHEYNLIQFRCDPSDYFVIINIIFVCIYRICLNTDHFTCLYLREKDTKYDFERFVYIPVLLCCMSAFRLRQGFRCSNEKGCKFTFQAKDRR